MEEENQRIKGEENETVTNFKTMSEGSEKKKGKGKKVILFIGIIILLLAIVIGLVYYVVIYRKPDKMYKRVVQSTLDSYANRINYRNERTSKTSLKLKVNLDIDKMDEKIKNFINQLEMEIDVQKDNPAQKLLVDIKTDYDKEELFDLQAYYDREDEKTFIQLKNWLDKYIELENVDNTYLQEILANQNITSEKKEAFQKAIKIIKKELTDRIKKEYCSAQKEEITIQGKNKKATRNSIKMSSQQLKEESLIVLTNLTNNQEFMNCFDDKEEIAKILDDLMERIEDITDDESIIEIAVYTTGLLPKIQKVEFIVYGEKSNETATIAVTQIDKGAYYLALLENEKTICTGSMKLEEKNGQEGTIDYEIEIPDLGKAKLKVQYSHKANEMIEQVNVSNRVKVNELTRDDQQTLMKNIQNSKLYELIESFSNSPSSQLIENNNNSNNDNENEIISHDGKQKITFQIPEDYSVNEEVSDKNVKQIQKDNVAINIGTIYGNQEDYDEELQETKSFYEEEELYQNVELSDMRKMKVNGRNFCYAIFTYETSMLDEVNHYEKTYFWSEISDEMVLYFEIENSVDLTNEELKELLKLTIED